MKNVGFYYRLKYTLPARRPQASG